MTNLSRRSLLKFAGAGGAALAFGGPLAVAGKAFAAGRDKELNILCWEGYNSAEVLDPYRRLRGATVKAESATNDPTMVNRLRAGETAVWDLINVNNPWARKLLWPEKLIRSLDRATFEPFFDRMLPEFKPPYKWSMSENGSDLLGMAQRFGPFCFVVNTDKISRTTAEDQGWDLWSDKALAGRYGIQESDDWNVAHTFMIAGVNPYKSHTPAEMAKFSEAAKRLFKGARLVSDLASVNQALISGEIDLYLSGGNYTSSVARADGHKNVLSITPKTGPIDGKGGIMWVEITSLVANPNPTPLAEDFLKYVQDPEVSHQVAFAEGTFNPVAQMGNPECFKLFSKEELDIIQWDTLAEEMDRSVAYDIVPDYDQALDIMIEAKRNR